MSIVSEFREFAVKGNVVDLAVGVVIGAAFGKIVSSLVEDVVMPVAGTLMGGVDFSGLALKIGSATLKYGKFMQTCLDFLIIAWAIFIMVKLINRVKREAAAPAPAPVPKAPPRQEVLLEEIRDLLKKT
jgi:large conductance mechanosensitive channel